jgi:hypothetical protein
MRRYSRYPLDTNWMPPARMMAAAPLLDDYDLVGQGEDLHLTGIIHGSTDHRFPDGSRLTTGVIQVMDEEAGYALGYNGAYRLGAPRNGGNT